jgi:hypothetical protein
MTPPATWRTDDPCPVCATALLATLTTQGRVRQDCALCGWSTTWNTTPEGGCP